MAKPIQQTPVLEGKSSQRFNELLASNENNKVSAEEKLRIQQLVEKILNNTNKK